MPARMHPKTPDPAAPDSERKLFELLRDGLPERCTVLHARRFVIPAAGRGHPEEGELDFLVIDPERGWLGLEVKGGGVERDRDGWTSTDRDGKRHRIKDPGRQVQAAVHALAGYLRGRSESLADASFGWGVALPDVHAPADLGPDLPRGLVLDRSDLDDLPRSFMRLVGAAGLDGPALDKETVGALLDALAPRLSFVESLAARIEADARELFRLTKEQARILDMLEDSQRLAVEGPAGSGKTLVARERCRRLAERGERVLLLCYNDLLGEYLAERAEGFTARCFHEHCEITAKAAGLRFEKPTKPKEKQHFYEVTAAELLDRALDKLQEERYDAVVVDEGQDFDGLWWMPIEKLLRDPENSSLWVFHDPHQNIFGRAAVGDLGLPTAKLPTNCRNTRNIAEYCCDLVAAPARTPDGAPEGVEVREIACATSADMITAVRKLLHDLIHDEGLDRKQILVLSAASAERSVVRGVPVLGNYTLVDYPEEAGPDQVRFATLGRFKGLEADVVILCDVKEGVPYCTQRHLYVGASRARHVLVVVRYGGAAHP